MKVLFFTFALAELEPNKFDAAPFPLPELAPKIVLFVIIALAEPLPTFNPFPAAEPAPTT
ncbi:hypothetical protein DLM45_04580 [Hyphomicrobium methylovorum]|nr:hypothetical protein [Hyphomicrobium methylovorum]